MSSVAQRMPLKAAEMVAGELVALLSEHCKRVVVAGSIRRKMPWVGDVEIVCIPKLKQKVASRDLFGAKIIYNNQVMRYISSSSDFEKLKGGERYQKLLYKGEVVVDLFMTTKQEWGRILALRTGSDRYSKLMSSRWVQLGYHGIDGKLIHEDTKEPAPAFPTEQSFFEFLQWKYIEPEKRR